MTTRESGLCHIWVAKQNTFCVWELKDGAGTKLVDLVASRGHEKNFRRKIFTRGKLPVATQKSAKQFFGRLGKLWESLCLGVEARLRCFMSVRNKISNRGTESVRLDSQPPPNFIVVI